MPYQNILMNAECLLKIFELLPAFPMPGSMHSKKTVAMDKHGIE